ncbi:MAG: hypothetical protein QOE33_2485 [Acidobacteriota bacterium]|nr:hypothetical protein [Acidobacteriota bacterium]
MTKVQSTLKGLSLLVFMLALTSLAHAQATRTWVSGVGDDANPCSRTAPCKTFAGAISKTFINGEIDALDPGGFGTITITKSITIDGGDGTIGSILASGSPAGATINLTDASGNDPQHTVNLRNLRINGTGSSGTVGTRTGTNGIRIILAAGAVNVEKCLITDFSNRGISDERASGKLFITDTNIRNCSGTGVSVNPVSGASSVTVAADNLRVFNSNFGIAVAAGAKGTFVRSNFSGNTQAGIYADGLAGASELNVDESTSANNGTGVQNGGGSVTIRLSNTNLTNNTTAVSGSVLSYGNNRVAGGAGALTPIGADTHDKGQQ